MAGLSLNVGGWGSSGIGTAVPAASNNPGSPTIQQAGFGITAIGAGQRTTAGYGAVISGAAAAAILFWLYCSLPR